MGKRKKLSPPSEEIFLSREIAKLHKEIVSLETSMQKKPLSPILKMMKFLM